MKIAICGSIAFYDEMERVKKELEELGHEVVIPESHTQDELGNKIHIKDFYALKKTTRDNSDWIWERKKQRILDYFDKIARADAILVLNHDKNDIANYIGPNTLMEMGLALYLGKKIFLLNPIPEMNYKEEILGMAPIVIYNDLTKII